MNNIYKRQINDLGIELEEYAQLVGMPEKVVKKIVNGNGEVIKDMEINNFLRKSLFTKHQEIETKKDEKKMEVLNVKMRKGMNSNEYKKQWLLETYADSKEVQWYVNEYNKYEYFKKYDVKNKIDLIKRYNFSCKEGRLKNEKEIGYNTIDRIVNKNYRQLGTETAYPLICQLYDCFKLGNIAEGAKLMQSKENTFVYDNEKQLKGWYDKFDFRDFSKKYEISTIQIAKDLNVSASTIKAIKRKTYIPSLNLMQKLYGYVNKYETIIISDEHNDIASEESMMQPYETKTVTGSAKVFEIPDNEDIMKLKNDINNDFIKIASNEESTIAPLYNDNEDILRNLLKGRLSEEEKTLIRIFGGKI